MQSLPKIERNVLAATIFCLPFGMGFVYNHIIHDDLVFLSDVLLGTLYVLWLYRTSFFSRGKLYFGKFFGIGIMTIVWSLFSMISAVALMATGLGVYMLIKSLLLYFYLVNNINSRPILLLVVKMMVLTLLFQGLLGTTQIVLGRTVGLAFLGEIPKSFHKDVSRVTGTMGYPNQLGSFLILILPLAFSMAAFLKRSTLKWILIAASGFGLMVLFLTLSRSSWAGFGLSMIVFMALLARRGLLKPKFVGAIALLGLTVCVIVYANMDTIEARFDKGSDGTWRMLMLEIAFPIIKSYPVFGVGLNNYQWHSFSQFTFWHPVHNDFLRLAAETGIPGVIIFISMFIVFLKECYKNILVKDVLFNAISIGAFCAVIAFIVAINIGPQYQHYRIKLTFWALAGVVFSLQRLRRLERIQMKKKELRAKKQLEKGPTVQGLAPQPVGERGGAPA